MLKHNDETAPVRDAGSVALVTSAVSMKEALSAQRWVSSRFTNQAKSTLVDMLNCPNIRLELASVSFTNQAPAALFVDQIGYRFPIDQSVYGYMALDKTAPAAMVDLFYGGDGQADEPCPGSITERRFLQDVVNMAPALWLSLWPTWLSESVVSKRAQSQPTPSMPTSTKPATLRVQPVKQWQDQREPLLVSYYHLHMGSHLGSMFFAMPAFLVSQRVRPITNGMEQGEKARHQLFETMQEVGVPVRAELARSQVSIAQVRQLEAGSVLPLNQWPDKAYLKSGPGLIYTATPVREGDQLLLEVTL